MNSNKFTYLKMHKVNQYRLSYTWNKSEFSLYKSNIEWYMKIYSWIDDQWLEVLSNIFHFSTAESDFIEWDYLIFENKRYNVKQIRPIPWQTFKQYKLILERE